MLDSTSLVNEQVGAGGACGCCDSGCVDGGGIGRDLKIKKITLSCSQSEIVTNYMFSQLWR